MGLNIGPIVARAELRAYLLEPEQKVFQKVIDKYVEKNNQFFSNGLIFDSFKYMGKVFKATHFTRSMPVNHPSLHHSLAKEFSNELKEHEKAEMSFNYIWQAVLPVVSDTFTVKDLPLRAEQLAKLSPVQQQNYRDVEDSLNYLLALRLIT